MASPAFGQALPEIDRVDYDARGRFRVNGQPFFPILLYDPPKEEAALREIKSFGFNVLACDPKICDALPAQGFYGAVHAGRKIDGTRGIFLGIGTDSPALNYKKDLLKKVAETNAKVQAALPGRPVMNAIGYWEDEPQGVFDNKLPSKEKYEELVAAIDVSAPYLYPIPYHPVSTVGDAMARARVASEGKKPLLPILQIFAWKATDRYPTPAELRAMAFLSLVEGAHGIGFYSYGHITGHPKKTIAEIQPDLWKSVKDLNREIAEIAPRLVEGNPIDLVAVDPANAAIKLKSIQDAAGHFTVIVNTSDVKQPVTLVAKKTGRSKTLELAPFGVATVP